MRRLFLIFIASILFSFIMGCSGGDVDATMVCSVGEKECVGTNAYKTCNKNGTGWDEPVECKDEETCIKGDCISNTCTPGEKVCAGNTLKTCNTDGTGWEDTPCGDGYYCEGSECKVQACTPNEKRCNGDNVEQCLDSDGDLLYSWEQIQTCTSACAEGACVNCADDNDCSAPTSLCETTSHTCVECLVQSDCGANSTCTGNACVCSFEQCVSVCCDEGDVCYASNCCTPKDCTGMGYECGNQTNNCGQTIDCGFCTSPEICNAQGQCETATVYLTDYWPIGVIKLYRRYDNTVYLKQVHDSVQPHQNRMPQKAGSTYWRLHDYGGLNYGDPESMLVYRDTWQMRNSTDGQVAEVADSFANQPIVNSTFDTDTSGWNVGNGTLTVVSGELQITNNGTTYGFAYQTIPTVAGKSYALNCKARRGIASEVHLRAGTTIAGYDLGNVSTTSTTMVDISFHFTATTDTTYVTLVNDNTNNGTGYFDDVKWWFTEVTYDNTAYYYAEIIGHGRPGGHTVGETDAYEQWDIDFWLGANDNPPQPPQPPSYDNWTYSIIKLLEKYDTFTPDYGNSGGGFGQGNAPTYNDVIKIRFQHGSASGDTVCGNQPAEFVHVTGYTSYWVDIWLAPGVGRIQGHILWYEKSCDGDALTPSVWRYYLDKIEY